MGTRAPADLSVDVRTIGTMDEVSDAMAVLRAIWSFPDGVAPISAELLRAMALAGAYVGAAYAGDRMVGAAAGFLGHRDGAVLLHSHIAGVVPDMQSRHVGLALKLHQRDWAEARGVRTIEWTFDPLVRRNAYFNLMKLGARIAGFEPDFYGEMHDAINAGDPTDRAVIEWAVDGRGDRAASGGAGDVILEPDDAGRPVVRDSDAMVLRAWIPEDAVALRRADPAAGRAWRLALRESFGAKVRAGYSATAMTRDGWYTLVRGDRP